jgi:parvulin-like peptidyl-prolyl isomerase
MALVVNGELVEEALIQEEVERMRPRYEEVFAEQEPDEREAQLREWARENAIERVLINQEARRAPEPIAPEEIEAVYEAMIEQHGGEEELYRHLGLTHADEGEIKADIEHRLRVERLMDAACAHLSDPSDQDVAAYYEEHTDDFAAPEQVGVAHIVKHVDGSTDPETARKELAKAREELGQGADFAAVAEKYSDCPDNGGDLGYFPRGHMVEEFDDVVFTMPPGSVTDIFPSRFGFHIARVYGRKSAAPQPLEEIKEEVQAAVAEEMRREAIEAFIDQLRAKATIEETEEA